MRYRWLCARDHPWSTHRAWTCWPYPGSSGEAVAACLAITSHGLARQHQWFGAWRYGREYDASANCCCGNGGGFQFGWLGSSQCITVRCSPSCPSSSRISHNGQKGQTKAWQASQDCCWETIRAPFSFSSPKKVKKLLKVHMGRLACVEHAGIPSMARWGNPNSATHAGAWCSSR